MGDAIEPEGLFWSQGTRLKKAVLRMGKAQIALGLSVALLGIGVLSYRQFFKSKPVAPVEVVPIVQPRLAPTEPDLVTQARKALEQGSLHKSLALYQTALQKDPHHILLLNDTGYILWKLGRLHEADKIYLQIALTVSNCAECFNNWGEVKQALGELLEAEELFRRAILADTQYPDPHFNLGVLYEQNGDLANAQIAYEEYVQRQLRKSDISKSIDNRLEKLNEAY